MKNKSSTFNSDCFIFPCGSFMAPLSLVSNHHSNVSEIILSKSLGDREVLSLLPPFYRLGTEADKDKGTCLRKCVAESGTESTFPEPQCNPLTARPSILLSLPQTCPE